LPPLFAFGCRKRLISRIDRVFAAICLTVKIGNKEVISKIVVEFRNGCDNRAGSASADVRSKLRF
jgi:hypothetical protein